jgi:predicted ATP-binding protein involved in virulence
MIVESAHLRNFRAIGDFELALRPKTTVLVGLNGAGKTTLLDGIAVPLSHAHVLVGGRSAHRKPVQRYDIRNGASECHLSVKANLGGGSIAWSVTSRSQLGKVSTTFDDGDLRRYARELGERWRTEEGVALPFAVLFPTNRAVLDIPKRIREHHDFEQVELYDNALHDNWNNFRLFFEWFRDREDNENEVKTRTDRNWRDPQLNAVRRAFESMLPDFRDLRVERNPQSLTMLKGRERLIVQQLSDGEKCVLSLTADLARRLVIAHPRAEDPLVEAAFVMIDEAELHLHPAWQRVLIHRLRKTFPGCQLVVTTHSPQMISEVDADDVYLLARDASGAFTALTAESSYGRDTNFILQVLMGVDERNEDVKKAIAAGFRALDDGALDEARATLNGLRAAIGDDDPELVRLDLLLRRKESLRRASNP